MINEVINLILSLSISASILALILFAIKPFIKIRISKLVQYYIWIIVLLRLVVPLSFQDSMMNHMFYGDETSATRTYENNEINIQATDNTNEGLYNSSSLINQTVEQKVANGEYNNDIDHSRYLNDSFNQFVYYIWLLVAMVVFTVNVIGYVRFIRYIKRGNKPAKDIENEILSTLLKRRENIKLLRNQYISTPMLIGVFRPSIIIPDSDFDERQLKNILLHEITHMRHFDVGIKWLTMIATSIHWFNPFIYIIKKEMNNACELACDEAVIKNFTKEERQGYGDTLISIAEEQKYPIGVLQATMCEEKKNLKGRLVSIMKHNRKSKLIIAFSVILLASTIFGALYLGGALERGKENENISDIVVGKYNLTEISKYRTQYVGDSSMVSHIADNLPVPDSHFKQQYISMETSNKPYSLTIYYEPATDTKSEGEWPIVTPDSNIETNSRTNALVVFSMIDNVDKVTFAFRTTQSKGELDESKYQTTFTFPRASFENKYGDLTRLGENIVLLQDILEEKKSVMKGLELYVWREPEITDNNDIYYTLLIGTNRNKSKSEVFDMDIATSDLDVIKQELSEYRSGTDLSIMHEKEIDKNTMLKISDEFSEIIKNASIHILGIDFDNQLTMKSGMKKSTDFIEKNLEIIMSSPEESSNPMDYIKAHQQEYEELIKLNYSYENEEVLKYLLLQFEKGNAEGLRGHIMMSLCKELLGVRNNVIDESLSPLEWYERLEIRQEIILHDFSYDGTEFLEKLVYETEIKKNKNNRQGFTIVAPHIFGKYEEGNKLKVFITTFSSHYRLYDNVLSNKGGSIVPVAITYVKNSDGSYSLEEYKRAMDGAYFASSIKEFCTMPVSGEKIEGLAEKILVHYGKREDIVQLERENLIKHLKESNQHGVSLYEEHYKQPAELIPLT